MRLAQPFRLEQRELPPDDLLRLVAEDVADGGIGEPDRPALIDEGDRVPRRLPEQAMPRFALSQVVVVVDRISPWPKRYGVRPRARIPLGIGYRARC